MKKLLSFILICLIMTSCNSKDKSVSRRSESEEYKVDSVLQPMTFRENEIEFDDENLEIEDVFLSDNNIYLKTIRDETQRTIKLRVGGMENEEIDTGIECSYIYDVCCGEEYLYFCCSCKSSEVHETTNQILVVSKETGQIIKNKELDILSNYMEVSYDNGNVVLIYSPYYDEEIPKYFINIYDENLELKEQNFDVGEKVGMPGSAVVSFSETDGYMNALCMSFETQEIGFVRFSYVNDFYEYFTSEITVDSGYVPIALYSISDNRLLFQYCDNEADMTYVNVYDLESKKVTDMYDIDGAENYITPGENDYVFYLESEENIIGYRSSEETTDIIYCDYNDWFLLYDFYDNCMVMYRDENEAEISIYKIQENSYETIAEYDMEIIKDICVSKNDSIYALLDEDDVYRIQVSDEYGQIKGEISLDFPESAEIMDFCCDKSGNIFVLVNDGEFKLIEYDPDGNQLNESHLKNIISIYCMYINNADGVNIYANSYDGNRIYIYKDGAISEKELNEYMTYNYLNPCYSVYSDGMVFRDNNGIYLYSIDTQSAQEIFDMEQQVLSCSIDNCAVLSNDEIVFWGNDYISGKSALCIVQRSDAEKTESRLINVAEIGVQNHNLRTLFRKYDKSNDDYAVKITNYKNQNAFNEALGKGYEPDIITYDYQSGFNFARYVSKGYVEKLDNYILNDKDLKSDDYYWNLFKLESCPDGIYHIGSSAELTVMYSEKTKIDFNNVSMEYLLELSRNYGLTTFAPVSYTVTYNMILKDILGNYIENNINYSEDTFDADKKVVSDLLELAKLYYDNNEEIINSDLTDNEDYQLSVFNIYDFSHWYNPDNLIVFSAGADNCQASISDKMLISGNSHNKEEAWKIIKTILLDDYQNDIATGNNGFPVKKSAYFQKAEISREQEIKKSESILSDEHLNAISDILSCANTYRMPDNNITYFINECFTDYISQKYSSEEISEKLVSQIKRFLQEE
ncbi:MAG: carbohydrate ABC transporter substrate-binding protein [Ruminococcus sp.]|nr:carbohydrate ABC transporter substrate-binding protein [Ruminococcus sp.]